MWTSAVSMLLIGTLAVLTHEPWVFPSLGPTAFILYAAPMSAQASPRNTITANTIAVVAGVLGTALVGLAGQGPDVDDLSVRRVLAVAIALALTLSVMIVAVIALVVVGWLLNFATGTRMPLWSPKHA